MFSKLPALLTNSYNISKLYSWTEKKKEPVKPSVEREEVVVEIPRKILTVKKIKNLPANHGEVF